MQRTAPARSAPGTCCSRWTASRCVCVCVRACVCVFVCVGQPPRGLTLPTVCVCVCERARSHEFPFPCGCVDPGKVTALLQVNKAKVHYCQVYLCVSA